ncbi:MAG: hypothetical protein BME94_07530, partial [Methanobacteriales archaeon Met13]
KIMVEKSSETSPTPINITVPLYLKKISYYSHNFGKKILLIKYNRNIIKIVEGCSHHSWPIFNK